MSVRELMMEKKQATPILAGALLLIGLGAMTYQIISAGSSNARREINQYYSTDDGKTWFPDSEERFPPFDHAGAQAVRAHVFHCGDKTFVGYLEEFTPEAKHIIQTVTLAAKSAKPGDKPPPELARIGDAQRNGRVVKRPGEASWVPINGSAGAAVKTVFCPDSKQSAQEIQPP